MYTYGHGVIRVVVFMMLVMKGDGTERQDQTISEPFTKSLHDFAVFNNDMQQKYRSIGLLDDFSNIVNNMIKSLQEVQTKGEGMVKKIRTQESKLEKVMKEIKDKEDHIKKVSAQMQQIEEINKRIEAEVNSTEEKKKNVQNEITRLEEKQGSLKQELKSYSKTIQERKVEEEREMKQFKSIRETKAQNIERMKSELSGYETKIADATKALSEIEEKQEEKVTSIEVGGSVLRSEIFYPILLLSLLFNLVIGGQILNIFSPLSGSFMEKSDEEPFNLDPIFALTKAIGQQVLAGKKQ